MRHGRYNELYATHSRNAIFPHPSTARVPRPRDSCEGGNDTANTTGSEERFVVHAFPFPPFASQRTGHPGFWFGKRDQNRLKGSATRLKYAPGQQATIRQDGLGSSTSLSDLTGTLVSTYTYDSFGKLTASTGSLTNPFRYTGCEFDAETGLYFFRARYGDPSVGKFLSEDEIGNDEGTNLYPYVANNPIRFRDPTGFYKLKGFPPDLEQQMRDAIEEAISKLEGDGCNGCAGPNGPKIVDALQRATFVYKPDLPYCGLTNPIYFFRKIEVGNLSFDTGKCCSLASTLAHEGDHYGASATDKDKPGSAYDMEKKCFNCGTGHPPPR